MVRALRAVSRVELTQQWRTVGGYTLAVCSPVAPPTVPASPRLAGRVFGAAKRAVRAQRRAYPIWRYSPRQAQRPAFLDVRFSFPLALHHCDRSVNIFAKTSLTNRAVSNVSNTLTLEIRFLLVSSGESKTSKRSTRIRKNELDAPRRVIETFVSKS